MTKRTIRGCLLATLGACLVMAGCYNPKEVDAFLLKPRAPVSGKDYRILPPDVIVITSRHIIEIDRQTQQVRPDGKINLPLIGEVMVADKTPEDVEKLIKTAAEAYYDSVDATVTVTGYNSQKFYVFGQVATAGPMPWTGHDTLLDALAKARPNDLAWPERIIIVRGPQPRDAHEGGLATTQSAEDEKKYHDTGVRPQDPNNPRAKLTVNLMAMIKEGDLTNNIYLLPNDVIYVQPNPFAAIGLAFQSLFMPVRPVLEAVRVPAAVSGPLSGS